MDSEGSWSDSAVVHADLDLHYQYMLKGTFSLDVSQISA